MQIASAPNGEERVDRRKLRQLKWTEARLCLAHEPGSVTPVFGARLAALGGPAEAGLQLLNCAIRAGVGTATKLHCLGDGAVWIADQVEQRFGLQARYLVDFYHTCEYLSAAASQIPGQDTRAWREREQQKLKENRASEVLQDVLPFLEPDTDSHDNAPVRACHRYITNRLGQLDYQAALQSGLPIGSGEVESGHGYIIQDRLKLSGAWWKIENARKMLALRVSRANLSPNGLKTVSHFCVHPEKNRHKTPYASSRETPAPLLPRATPRLNHLRSESRTNPRMAGSMARDAL